VKELTTQEKQALQKWLDAAPKGVVAVELNLGDGVPTLYRISQ